MTDTYRSPPPEVSAPQHTKSDISTHTAELTHVTLTPCRVRVRVTVTRQPAAQRGVSRRTRTSHIPRPGASGHTELHTSLAVFCLHYELDYVSRASSISGALFSENMLLSAHRGTYIGLKNGMRGNVSHKAVCVERNVSLM